MQSARWNVPYLTPGSFLVVDGITVTGVEVPQANGYGPCSGIRWEDRGITVEARRRGGVNGHYGTVLLLIGPDQVTLASDYNFARDAALTPELEAYALNFFDRIRATQAEAAERRRQQVEVEREAAEVARRTRAASIGKLLAG